MEKTSFPSLAFVGLLKSVNNFPPSLKLRRDKQILRDAGLLLHIGRGRWQIDSK